MFGEEAGGPIFLSDLSCSSEETTLLECLYSTVHQCDHTQDVGVQCFGMYHHALKILSAICGALPRLDLHADSQFPLLN